MIYHLNGRTRPVVVTPSGLMATLWLGVLIGVSFLATPVKFQAPSLDLPTALDVGRVTFALASKVEWGLWGLLVATSAWGRVRMGWLLVGLLGAILAAQGFWLLPILDERVAQIIAGQVVAATPHHLIYVMLEGLKAVLLILVVVTGLRRRA